MDGINKKKGSADILAPGDAHNEFVAMYGSKYAQYESKIDRLIDFVEKMKTSQLERIATLFAVWNDFIIDGISTPTDDQIVADVMSNWTKNKANTKRDTWQGTLNKMKSYRIVPNGLGLHTLVNPRRECENE